MDRGVKHKMGSPNNEEKIDHISKLPDAILTSILSFIPTRKAVQTSLLSTRWKFVWTQVPVLDFPHFPRWQSGQGLTEERKIYFESMCRAILQHNVAFLKHLTITFFVHDDESFHTMKSLLDILRWRQYCELNMTFMGRLARLPLPNEFLSCQRLVSLDLDGLCIDDSLESFHLPNLESVRFGCMIEFPSDHFLRRFLLGCPALKKLFISRGFGLGHIYVESSTLVSLEIQSLQCESPIQRVTIKASNLRYLTLFNAYAHYVVVDLPLLTEAHVCVFSFCATTAGLDDNLVQLIKKASSMTTLLLGISELSRFNDVLPKYENLTHLRLLDDGCVYELLKRAPKLKSLTLDMDGGEVLGNLTDCDVPECLSCLEKVELYSFRKDDISVAKYFLKNGSSLKELIVYPYDNSSIESCRKIGQVLRDGPTSSPLCQVQILLYKDSRIIHL